MYDLYTASHLRLCLYSCVSVLLLRLLLLSCRHVAQPAAVAVPGLGKELQAAQQVVWQHSTQQQAAGV